jgi:hypothetical protein
MSLRSFFWRYRLAGNLGQRMRYRPYRFLMGLASIWDGLVICCSLTTVYSNASCAATRCMNHKQILDLKRNSITKNAET